MKELENKVALVSSSTRGIGLACAKTLAAQGAAVYLGVRRLEAGQQIADELIAAGGRAGVVFFDASREESFSGMVDEVAAKEGRLDILVNNFGSTDVKTDLDVVNGPSEDFFRIVNTNLKSVYLPSKAAVPLMAKNGGGSIINIGSVGGLYPDLSRTAYGVSKAAIHFLTKDIAVQYARQGVRCNAVLPGFTATVTLAFSLAEPSGLDTSTHCPSATPSLAASSGLISISGFGLSSRRTGTCRCSLWKKQYVRAPVVRQNGYSFLVAGSRGLIAGSW